jgi:hypothetical protein
MASSLSRLQGLYLALEALSHQKSSFQLQSNRLWRIAGLNISITHTLAFAKRFCAVSAILILLGLDCQIQAKPLDLAITTIAVQARGSDPGEN